MKRYIKTKRHIYKRFPEEGYIMNEEGVGITDGSPELNPFDEEIVKEADTIEELCDELVMTVDSYWPSGKYFGAYLFLEEERGLLMNEVKKQENRKELENMFDKQGYIYGSIWVFDKHGAPTLKSVAKMNVKGEWELL